MPVSNAPVHVDPEWQVPFDLNGAAKVRNVRGPSGMIIGRILCSSSATRFEAQVWNRGIWKTVGAFDEFDQAAAAASAPIEVK